MPDQRGQETLERRGHFIEIATKDKIHFVDSSVAPNTTTETLDLSRKYCDQLPSWLGDLKCLETLILSSNKLTNLPTQCVRLNTLKTLDLSRNRFKELPSWLGELQSLETLVLSSNELSDLPTQCIRFNTLKTLDLSRNCFKELPSWLGELQSLETLNLSSNKLADLPTQCLRLNTLKTLDLSRNCFKELPFWLGELQSLETLNLSSNKLSDLPTQCLRLNTLKTLDLSRNCFNELPFWLEELQSLETLNLSSNELSDLPTQCLRLNTLKTLDLSRNCFNELPFWLEELQSLETLNLSSNKLLDLPPECARLYRLKNLDLSSNFFKQFPFCLTKGMRSLESLNVSQNKYINVSTAPASENLKRLYIREIGGRSKFPLWLFSGCAPKLKLLDLEGTRFKAFGIPDNCPSLSITNLSLSRCGFYDKFVNELTRFTDRLERLQIGNASLEHGGNAFSSIPIENLRYPELLTDIDLRRTGLFDVCPAIERCVNLVRLDIGSNNINRLSSEICSLAKLEVLLIDENYLCALPDEIGRLTALEELKANDNGLDCLPESTRELKNLAYLDLYNNEFAEMPTAVRHAENLYGLDIDQNNFTINDSDCIGSRTYEILRKAVRDRYYNRGYNRRTGPRYEREPSELDHTGSDISSIEFHDSKTNAEQNANGIDRMEEDWDNSADEFDPTQEIQQRPGNGEWSSIERAMALGLKSFCPADLHAQSVRTRVAQLRANGEIIDDVIEENQFEDA